MTSELNPWNCPKISSVTRGLLTEKFTALHLSWVQGETASHINFNQAQTGPTSLAVPISWLFTVARWPVLKTRWLADSLLLPHYFSLQIWVSCRYRVRGHHWQLQFVSALLGTFSSTPSWAVFCPLEFLDSCFISLTFCSDLCWQLLASGVLSV